MIAEGFASWLIQRLGDAAQRKFGRAILGSEQERALRAVGTQAIVRTAYELNLNATESEVSNFMAVLNEVFELRSPRDYAGDSSTMLETIQQSIYQQVAVLDDSTITGVGQSSAEILLVPTQSICESLTRNTVREVLLRGTIGGPLAQLANQLNHDLTHIQLSKSQFSLEHISREIDLLKKKGLSPTSTVPHELPRRLGFFTGRLRELDLLSELLVGDHATSDGLPLLNGSPQVAAIWGMAGVGKSALATELAHRLGGTGRFPDGEIYIDLQGSTPGLQPLHTRDALSRMLQALGLASSQIPDDSGAMIAAFRSLASSRRLLITLDNVWDESQAHDLIPASQTSAVIVTSRKYLAQIAATASLHLEPLECDEAVRLLERTSSQRYDTPEQTQQAREIAALCGRLPLALRIAGAKLASHPTRSLEAVAKWISGALENFETFRVGNLQAAATLDLSLSDFITAGRSEIVRAFGTLSLFDSLSIDSETAARILGESEQATCNILDCLVEAQLLQSTHENSVMFHDLVRAYAREQSTIHLTELERKVAVSRVTSFQAATAVSAASIVLPGYGYLGDFDPAEAYRPLSLKTFDESVTWLDRQRRNLTSATLRCLKTDIRSAGILARSLFSIFEIRDYWEEGKRLNAAVVEAAENSGNVLVSASARNDMGHFSWQLGEYFVAIDLLRKAAADFEVIGELRGVADSYRDLGVTYWRLGDFGQAVQMHCQSLAVCDEIGYLHGAANSLSNLGMSYQRLGDLSAAESHQRRALSIFESLGDFKHQAVSLSALGLLQRDGGEIELAFSHQTAGLALYQQVGARQGYALSLTNLGRLHSLQGDQEKAIELHNQSLVALRELGDRWASALVLRNLGDSLGRLGRLYHAKLTWSESLDECVALGMPERDELVRRLEDSESI